MSAVERTNGRGRKHRCAACGAAFYDLGRELSACPKCETPYEAAAPMPRGEAVRKRRAWSKAAPRPEPEAAPDAPAAEAAEEDSEGVPMLDTADDADETEVESEAAEDDEG